MNAQQVDVLLTLALGLLTRAVEIHELLQRARSEGRDVSDLELDLLFARAKKANEDLRTAIEGPKQV